MRFDRPSIVDAHCHLNLFDDPRAVARRAEANGVFTLAVTNSPADYRRAALLLEGFLQVQVALGLHPQRAGQRVGEMREFLDLLPSTHYVGEIGLDYFFCDPRTRAVQRRIFEKIIEACHEIGDKVLSVHSRRAAKDVIDVIGNSFRGTVILHWYLDSLREMERALERGFYFSVNRAMFRSAGPSRILPRLPCTRVLTETDGPFLRSARRPDEPRDVAHLLSKLAKLWGKTYLEVAESVSENAGRLSLGLRIAPKRSLDWMPPGDRRL